MKKQLVKIEDITLEINILEKLIMHLKKKGSFYGRWWKCKQWVSDISVVVDSGCTNHLVNDKKYFNNLLILENPINIVVNDEYSMQAIGVGIIEVISIESNQAFKCTTTNICMCLLWEWISFQLNS